jgi:hypothetical protein
MSKDGEAEPTDVTRWLVQLRGLQRAYQRAYALFPDTVMAAYARGRRPIGAFPEKFSATTEPAGCFSAVAEPNE